MSVYKIKHFVNKIEASQPTAVYISELPEKYRKMKKIGRGMTATVLQKDENTVIIATRDIFKVDWLTQEWGIKLGKTVELLEGNKHRIKKIRDKNIYIVEMPKLIPITRGDWSKLKPIVDKFTDIIFKHRSKHRFKNDDLAIQEAIIEFENKHPNSFLHPLINWSHNYDKDLFFFDISSSPRNFMKDKKGNIIILDPVADKEIIGLLRGYKK